MYSGYSGHIYSGQSDIVARNCWPNVATIPEVHYIPNGAEELMEVNEQEYEMRE